MLTFYHLKNDSKSGQKHHWQCGIKLSSQSSDRNSLYNRKLHELARFHLSTLGICNAYLDCYLIGQICFYSGGLGANQNVSGKLCMKLAINFQYACI